MAVVAGGWARWLGQVRDRQRDVMAWSHGNTETVTVLATSWHLARILFVFCDIIWGGVGVGAGRGRGCQYREDLRSTRHLPRPC